MTAGQKFYAEDYVDNYIDLARIAERTLDMRDELLRARVELERLKKVETEYKEFFDKAYQHQQTMAANQLNLLLTPGVAKALVDSTKVSPEVTEQQVEEWDRDCANQVRSARGL